MNQSITISLFIANCLLLTACYFAQSPNTQSAVGNRQLAIDNDYDNNKYLISNIQHPVSSIQHPEPTFSLLKTIPVNTSLFTTDNLGQLYIVENEQLLKYNPKGILLSTYSNKNLGNISFVDAANPLRLLLFYKDFAQVIFLDNALSILGGNISLEQMGFEQTTLICTSNDNGLWIYDPKDFRLIRLDQNLKTTYHSGDINQLLGIEINPNYLIEYNNWVYLNNPETGIMVFDFYGTYYKTIPLKRLTSFQVVGDNIFYFSDNYLKSYHLKSFEKNSINLPAYPDSIVVESPIYRDVRIEKQKLFLLRGKSLDLYLIKE
ncbi:MAG: hypothetical protein ABII90_01340 [Bacteroidota bacterium]